MVKVSVIVPIYNVKDYLYKCLDTLRNQTLKDIEIICVNDGSTDNSQVIIDEFVSMDQRFFSCIKKNGGLSDARNYGIQYVNGEYIFFLDSDDSLELNALEELYKFAKDNNNDLVICGYNEVSCNGKPTVKVIPEYGCFSSSLKEFPKLLNSVPHCAWNKLYKSELFIDKNIRFPKGLYYEDVGTTPIVYLEAKSIGYIPEAFINYLIDRPGNITQTVSKKITDIIKDLEIINDYYLKNNSFYEYENELCTFNLRLIFDNLWKIKNTEKDTYFSEFFDNCYTHLDKYFPNWKENIFFKSKNLKEIYVNYLRKNKGKYKKYLFGDKR